ncbi:hypothetical protein [Devosia sp. Root105]|uniref:hypothetical protein n=1 Tax=Devosia sp. Root105 TaxID=1736423 RepID=UPI0006FED67F|nr:hypothetical protein [Devosia sp. Root105]KQU93899.1 hypothetical protein ASC68_19645 [Devosia sp. Root105]
MPVFGIRIDTKKSASKALLPTDLALSAQILDVIYALALNEQRRWESEYQGMVGVPYDGDNALPAAPKGPSPLTIKVVRFSNPFDVVGFVKGITKPMIDAVLDRTLYYKQEVQRRELENAQTARGFELGDQEVKLRKQDVALRRQEVALKKQEAELKKQEAIEKKIENAGKVMSLLDRAKQHDGRHDDEQVMRALAEIIADQDAVLGSGNVQVYFPPRPKLKVRRRKRPTPKA